MNIKQFLVLLGCWWNIGVFALDDITFKLGSTTGNGWQAEGVVARLHWSSDTQLSLTVSIAALILPKLKQPLLNLKLTCPEAHYNHTQITCPQAFLESDLLSDSPLRLFFRYHLLSQRIDLRLTAMTLAGGQVTLQAKTDPSEWQANLDMKGVRFEQLLDKFKSLIELPEMLFLGGYLYLKVKLVSKAHQLTASLQGQLQKFNFANDSGTQAGEQLVVQIALTTTIANTDQKSASYQVQGKLVINSGEVYISPIYLAIKHDPIIVITHFTWQDAQLVIPQFSYTHTKVGSLQGSGEFIKDQQWAIKTLSLQLLPTAVKQLYHHYLQSWLGSDSLFGQLNVNGVIEGHFKRHQDHQQWLIQLQQVNLEHQQKRFGLANLSGTLQWHNQASHLSRSHLSWSRGYFASYLELGASQLHLGLVGQRIELLTPWHQPILDSVIHIEQFNLNNLGKKNVQWQLRSQLDPIALSKLSIVLGGLPLAGKLKLDPLLINYSNQRLQLDLPLRIHVFDGVIMIPTFILTEPFGDKPTLQADLEITKLNLQTLTKITQFGEIQGQLSGYIHGLQMINWQPIAFDAYFATPPDHTLPRQISQKAIDNLSNLGGGAAVNAISRSVLSIFEHFSYQRLGWGCRLEQGICQMRGVEPAATGYYIIKGGGLPRIDMIGYNDKVDWSVLLTRLKRVFHTHTPITQY